MAEQKKRVRHRPALIKIRLSAAEHRAAQLEALKRGLTVPALALLMFRVAAAEFFSDF